MAYLQQKLFEANLNVETVKDGNDMGGVKFADVYKGQQSNVEKYRHSFYNFRVYLNVGINTACQNTFNMCFNNCKVQNAKLHGQNTTENLSTLQMCENECKSVYVARPLKQLEVKHILI
jgi:hypothetical protein